MTGPFDSGEFFVDDDFERPMAELLASDPETLSPSELQRLSEELGDPDA